MAITLTIDSISVTVPSVKTAAALIRELRRAGEPGLPKVELGSEHDKQSLRVSNELLSVGTALKFLRTINDAHEGASTDAIMKVLGVTDPKAVGSRTSALNKLLKSFAMAPSSVYYSSRVGERRIWKGGDQLAIAIGYLREALTKVEV